MEILAGLLLLLGIIAAALGLLGAVFMPKARKRGPALMAVLGVIVFLVGAALSPVQGTGSKPEAAASARSSSEVVSNGSKQKAVAQPSTQELSALAANEVFDRLDQAWSSSGHEGGLERLPPGDLPIRVACLKRDLCVTLSTTDAGAIAMASLDGDGQTGRDYLDMQAGMLGLFVGQDTDAQAALDTDRLAIDDGAPHHAQMGQFCFRAVREGTLLSSTITHRRCS